MNNPRIIPLSREQTPGIIQNRRQALADAARQTCQGQLTTGTVGVISMRLPIAGLFLITPAGSSFEDIGSRDTCLVDATGTLLEESKGQQPPSETMFHLHSYMVRTDIHAIAHLHPCHASAYALRGEVFDLVTERARSEIKEVLRVQCRDCISRFCGLCSCRTDIRTSYAGVNVLLLKEDGVVILGTSLEDMLKRANLVEKTAQESFVSNSSLHT